MQSATSIPKNDNFTLERAEEDDEFEEFERDGLNTLWIWFIDWNKGETSLSESIHWEDNWDTTNKNDDFCKQLRAEFDKQKAQ